MAVYIDKLLVYETGKLKEIDSTDSLQITGSFTTSSWLKIGSYATGSLPSAVTVGAGTLAYDSTANVLKISDGGEWKKPAYTHDLQQAYEACQLTGNTFPASIRLSEFTSGPLFIDGSGVQPGSTQTAVQIYSAYSDYATSGWSVIGETLWFAGGAAYAGEQTATGFGGVYISGSSFVNLNSRGGTYLSSNNYSEVYINGYNNPSIFSSDYGNVYIGNVPRYDGAGRTVSVGSQYSSSTTTISAGTGGLTLQALSSGPVSLTSVSGTLTVSTTGAGSVSASTLTLTGGGAGNTTLQNTSTGQVRVTSGTGGIFVSAVGDTNIYGGNVSARLALTANTAGLNAPTINIGTTTPSTSTTAINIGLRTNSSTSTSTLHYGPFTNDTYIRLGQFATGSLPSATSIAGSLVYDSTTAQIKYSNGSVWSALSTGGGGGGSTLQQAYDAGNSITLTSGRNLVVSVPTSGTAAVSLAANANSTFDVTSANLTLSTTTSGTLTLTGASGISATTAVTASNYVRVGNLATGSFPAATSLGGALLFDTSTTTLKYSDGTNWQTLGTSSIPTLQQAYGSGNTITLTSARPLVVNGTATTNDLYVGTDGWVGLGTSSPQGKLQVNGVSSGGIAPVIALGASSAGDTRDIRITSTTGGMRLVASSSVLTSSPDGAALQFYSTGHAALPGQVYIDSGAVNGAFIALRTAPTSGTITERLRVTAQGLLGVGTSSPLTLAHFASAATNTDAGTVTEGQLFLEETEQAGSGLILGYNYKPNTIGPLGDNSRSYGKVQARTSAGVAPLSLNPGGGNVGVGVNNPTFPLHVIGSVGANSGLNVDAVLGGDGTTPYVGTTSVLGFNVVINSSPAIQINTNKRVGINNTPSSGAPLARLTVSGATAENEDGVVGLGTGDRYGIRGQGGPNGGHGGNFVGGTTNGWGLFATGSGSGSGLQAMSGVSGGYGLTALALTSGYYGVYSTGYGGTDSGGVYGRGYGTANGGYFNGGTTSPTLFSQRERAAGVVAVGGATNSFGGVFYSGSANSGNTATNFLSAGIVAFGGGTNNHGVIGVSSGAAATTNGWGVVGWGSDGVSAGNGVLGAATGNGKGVQGNAAGTGIGVYGVGASPAALTVSTARAGVVGQGGSTGGYGVIGEGGGNGFAGGYFKGGPAGFADGVQGYGTNNGAGVAGYGQGTGWGGYFVGGTSGAGVYGEGNEDKNGAVFYAGDNNFGLFTPAVYVNGFTTRNKIIEFAGPRPGVTEGFSSYVIGAGNTPRGWAFIRTGATITNSTDPAYLQRGYNVKDLTITSTQVLVEFGGDIVGNALDLSAAFVSTAGIGRNGAVAASDIHFSAVLDQATRTVTITGRTFTGTGISFQSNTISDFHTGSFYFTVLVF